VTLIIESERLHNNNNNEEAKTAYSQPKRVWPTIRGKFNQNFTGPDTEILQLKAKFHDTSNIM
jgi:hypothetical protein